MAQSRKNPLKNIAALLQQAATQMERGNLVLAEERCRQILKMAPGQPDATNMSGIIAAEKGDYERADRLISRAIKNNPHSPWYHNSRGIVLERQNRLKEALLAFGRVIKINPMFHAAHFNRGNIFQKQGCLDQAMAAYDRAIQINPQYAEAYNNRADALISLGRLEEALNSCKRAISINPNLAEAYIVKGNVLVRQGYVEQALDAYGQAANLDPGNSEAHCNYGNCLKDLGRAQEAEASYRRALELKPDYAGAHSNLVFLYAAGGTLSSEEMLEEQRAWDRLHGKEGRAQRMPPRIMQDLSGRRLRIGYVSPDLRRHPVSYFFEPLLAGHDRACVEVFCYDANVHRPDTVTERLRGLAEHWRFVADKDDKQLAELIYEDSIDILVDLAGHTANNRLKAFAYRPAPVQASYLGFFAATGLESIDYWITDEVLHPLDTEEKTVERIYRLPRCAFCYQSPVQVPELTPCPHSGEDVVFGSFNHLSKLTPEVIVTWSRILCELPDSRLLLMFKPGNDPDTRQLLLNRFGRHGVSAGRISIYDSAPIEDYLMTYARVDIVLDAFPRTGGTTTVQALWMGVPVVTLAGNRYAGRISASKLVAIGQEGLIAKDQEDYIAKVLSLARDPQRRTGLRTGLREKIMQSSLSDGEGLAHAMESAYRNMWQQNMSQDSTDILSNQSGSADNKKTPPNPALLKR